VLSDEDVLFLINNYKTFGPTKCAEILGKNKSTIKATAKRYNLITDIIPGRPRKMIIYKISNNRTVMLCRHHGLTEFYVKPSGRMECLLCRRKQQKINHSTDSYRTKRNKWVRKRRSTKLGNYEHRLRTSLRLASNGQLSYTKNLPYTSRELCDHLEKTRKQQENICPMCNNSYDIVGYDIDHIIPISSASSSKQLLSFFNLKNLSLLCPTCNRYVKKDRLDVQYN
jgi:hypothetical protein